MIRTIKDDGSLENLLKQNSTVRRQDFKEYYRVNGAIYINLINEIDINTSFNDNKLGYIMDSAKSIDIDTYEDLEQVRNIMSNKI